MLRYFRLLRNACLAVEISAFLLAPTIVYALDFGPLNGNWEGQLKRDLGDGRTELLNRRIAIQDRQVRVFAIIGGKPNEIMPGKFQIQKTLTNAVIFATDFGRDSDGQWVETHLFVVTQKDRSAIIANFLRVVNNNDVASDKPGSKWSMVAAGDLIRK